MCARIQARIRNEIEFVQANEAASSATNMSAMFWTTPSWAYWRKSCVIFSNSPLLESFVYILYFGEFSHPGCTAVRSQDVRRGDSVEMDSVFDFWFNI